MKKSFNVNGLCYPDEHYMVDLAGRLKQIKVLVDQRKYFIINRARQYGKTTILWALNQYLQQEYSVISLSFQRMSTADFKDEYTFVSAFANAFVQVVNNKKKNVTGLNQASIESLQSLADNDSAGVRTLFECLSMVCATSQKPLVLMIDEVDSASNNQVFLDFLAQLRDYYLDRRQTPTFHSVILAGVYDIKNLKQKIRPDEEHRYNSPWNIAADFTIDMSFSKSDIEKMLAEYELDNNTDMNIEAVSGVIYDYTSGYPYLVSRICKLLDESIIGKGRFESKQQVWTETGITEAVKELLKESNTLFDDIMKKLEDFYELRLMLQNILFNGKSYPYIPYNQSISVGTMFGFIKEENNLAVISNRIFETFFYNLFLSEEMTRIFEVVV